MDEGLLLILNLARLSAMAPIILSSLEELKKHIDMTLHLWFSGHGGIQVNFGLGGLF